MCEKYGSWSDEEVKTFFKFVEIKKSEGLSLVNTFEAYAKCTRRHKNSVRNFYYGKLESLQRNPARCDCLGVDIEKHMIKGVVPFAADDTKKLISDIESLLSAGYSVRGACFELSGGDAKGMIRLQNKYRQETKYKRKEQMGNIIKMPIKKETISDGEINALFLGLIKLIKKQERETQHEQFERIITEGNEKLKMAFAEIISNRYKMDRLREQIKILTMQNEKLKESRIEDRIRNLNKKPV